MLKRRSGSDVTNWRTLSTREGDQPLEPQVEGRVEVASLNLVSRGDGRLVRAGCRVEPTEGTRPAAGADVHGKVLMQDSRVTKADEPLDGDLRKD
jgi:hypothetical protein